jgi:hypothetical protein
MVPSSPARAVRSRYATASSAAASVVPALRKMLEARTMAYWM